MGLASAGLAWSGGINIDEAVRPSRLSWRPASAGPWSAGTGPSTRQARAAAIRRAGADRLESHAAAAIASNGDEDRYPRRWASFTRALAHDAQGEVDHTAYAAYLKALTSGSAEDFNAIPLAGDIKLVNPQACFAFTMDGPDAHQLGMPPAPRFDSDEQAAEALELYWQALTRDVPFSRYDTDPLIRGAADELSRANAFRGPRQDGLVLPATIFRGSAPGEIVGPYISQFLWKEVPYGAIRLVPQVRTATPGLDYLVTWDDWLFVQNGGATQSKHASAYRYIRSARDLSAYVQLDFTYQAFLTAALILFGMEGTTDVRRPYKGAPYDAGNPYRGSPTQSGFSTFGVGHVLDLVARVANLSLRAAWYHKWLVHRRLRPEEYGGRLHLRVRHQSSPPIPDWLIGSRAIEETFRRHKTYLLPQAYPEGSPMHPSYPSGHAAIAGACVTVLKACFDERFAIEEPVVVQEDGLGLAPYQGATGATGATGPTLTVGGELNKLASNLGIGRNAAGIHWRSDNDAGLRLGEAIALGVLADLRACVNEPFGGYSLTTFDGATVTV